jgi:zeaxanthin glucosyltransferase
MTALARELIGRGHSVVFIGFPDVGSKLAPDLEFIAYGKDAMPAGSLLPFIDRLSGVAGQHSAPDLMNEAARIAELMLRELPRAFQAARADALLIDQSEPAPHMVARAMGIPFATVCNAMHMNVDPTVPPPMAPWRWNPSPAAVQRNIAAYRGIGTARRPVTTVLRHYARRSNITEFKLIDEIWSDVLQVTQCIQEFDFPRRQLPACFHYCGPFREPEAPLDFALPGDDRPLVFCSLGSLQGSRAHIFHNVAAAAADLGFNLLIAHGGKLSDAEAARLPGKPMVHPYVPQRAILPHCALAVTHAGLNTVFDALSCGTPLVGLPITFEQPGIAARLLRSGAGEVLYEQRGAADIKRAMQQVLANASYRANARRLGEEIRRAGGAARAVDLIEQAFAVRQSAPASAARS